LDLNKPLYISEIPIELRTTNIGIYNNLVVTCPECDYNNEEKIWNNVFFGERSGQVVMVNVCIKCGTKFYSHCGRARFETYKQMQKKKQMK
jgi:hypothetical protein